MTFKVLIVAIKKLDGTLSWERLSRSFEYGDRRVILPVAPVLSGVRELSVYRRAWMAQVGTTESTIC